MKRKPFERLVLKYMHCVLEILLDMEIQLLADLSTTSDVLLIFFF